MTSKAYISAISYYLPDNILTNQQIADLFPDWSAEKVANKIGVNQRHIVADGETATDMAEKVAIKLFKENDIDPKSIDFILLCTQSPDYFLPTSACILQDRLNIPTSAGAIDYNLGCSGYIYGLAIAKGLILANIAKNILLITSETYTKHIHPTDKGNRTIFGDAAAATLVSNTGFAEILDFDLGTDGRGADNLIIKNGANRHSKNGDLSTDYLYMNGAEIFNFTLESVPLVVRNVIKKNKLDDKIIDLYILHQANRYMLEFIRKKMNIDLPKFYYYLSDVGNTVSSTIPIALYQAKKEKKLKGNILLAGFGVGYSWGGVIIRVDN